MFDFTYTLNDEDYFEFNKYHTYNSKMNRKRTMRTRFLIPAIYIVCALALGSMISYPIVSYIIFGTISLYYLVFFNQIIDRRIKRGMKRIKKAGKLPIQNNIRIIFDENGITEKTEIHESKCVYSCIESIDIGKKAMYLYTGAVQAFVIPNSVFKDASEKESFKQFIESKTVTSQ